MKYPSVCLIINILAISVIFSSADDFNNPDIKQVHSTALITIKESEKQPEEPVDDSPLTADILFINDDGNNIAEIEDGMSIKFNIIVKTDKKYKDGRVMKCEIYESANISNIKTLSDECTKDASIDEWVWNQENQIFETNFKVMKPPGSQSDEVTIECSAIVCKENCPNICSERKSRRKRSGLLKKLSYAVFVRARTNG